MSGADDNAGIWTQRNLEEGIDPSGKRTSTARIRLQRHLIDMLGFLDVVGDIIDKGRESFVDPANHIDFHAAKSLLIDLNSAADAIVAADPAFQADHPQVPWSDLHQTRSKLSHHYEGIYRARLWGTLTVDLAALRPIIEALAAGDSEPSAQ